MLAWLVQLHLKYFVLRSDAQFIFETFSPGEMPASLMTAVTLFRTRQFERDSSYLLAAAQTEVESVLALDVRSHHITARRKNGELVGALRLTQWPFEISVVLSEQRQFSENLKQNLEIGRLVTDPSVKNVGKKLLILAGIHAVEKTSSQGFVGICRVDKISYFRLFGMQEIGEPVKVNGRPHSYYIISGNFSTMRTQAFRNFVTRLSVNPFKIRPFNTRRLRERIS